MHTRTWLKSATLGAAALAMIGCSDGDTVVSDSNDVGNLWPDDPQELGQNPFKAPTHGLHYYSGAGSMSYDVQDVAVNSAKPGADNEDLIADRSQTYTDQGDVAYQSSAITNGDGDINFNVIERYASIDLLLPSGWSNLARGDDNAVYSDAIIPSEWKMALPNTKAVGTSWIIQWPNKESAKTVYAYKDIGSIAHSPKLKTIQDGSDPSDYNAVDSAGGVVSDISNAVVEYTTSTGYDVMTVSYRPIVHYKVVADNVTSPDEAFTGCLQIQAYADYRLDADLMDGYTAIGLDSFSMGATYYWKQDLGVVYATMTMTSPTFGFGFQSSPNEENDTTLSSYNANYDNGYFNTSSASVFHSSVGSETAFGNTSYETYYELGFRMAYTDSSTGTAANNRLSLSAAITEALDDLNLADDDLINDSQDEGYKKGQRAAFDAAFTAGYNAGASDYSNDYTENTDAADAYDAANADNSGADYTTYEYNDTPEAFRPDGKKYVQNFGGYDILDGATLTGVAYSNRYDGLGRSVNTYDSSRTTYGTMLRAKDAYNQDYTAYTSLPVVGRTDTDTMVWTLQGDAGDLAGNN